MKKKPINDLHNRITVDPEEYLRLLKTDKKNIKKTEIVPPQIGENGFGRFIVTLTTPVYQP